MDLDKECDVAKYDKDVTPVLGYRSHSFFFFFLNQQFIIESVRADHGRHNISTYIEMEPTCEQKRREKERKIKNKRKKRKEY